jgi:uncharacterized membrane protein
VPTHEVLRDWGATPLEHQPFRSAGQVRSMMHWGYTLGPWFGDLIVRGTLLFGLVVLIGWLLGRDRTGPSSDRGPDPELLLAQRFAAGEIDSAEFLARRAVLRGAGTDGQLRSG